MFFSSLILDDELKSRKALSQKLNLFCPEVKPVLEASDVDAAWNLFKQKEPNILFVDIHLSGELGFELLNKISENKSFQAYHYLPKLHNKIVNYNNNSKKYKYVFTNNQFCKNINILPKKNLLK